jgi:hypothetical protein
LMVRSRSYDWAGLRLSRGLAPRGVSRSCQSHLRRSTCRTFAETSHVVVWRVNDCCFPSIIYLGMDVHKDSITIAVLSAGAKSPTHVDRLPNDPAKLKRYIARVARQGEIRSCYEASGAGYVTAATCWCRPRGRTTIARTSAMRSGNGRPANRRRSSRTRGRRSSGSTNATSTWPIASSHRSPWSPSRVSSSAFSGP